MSEDLIVASVLLMLVTGGVVWALGIVLALAVLVRLAVRGVRRLSGSVATAGKCPVCKGSMETCTCGGNGRPPWQPRPVAGGAQ